MKDVQLADRDKTERHLLHLREKVVSSSRDRATIISCDNIRC